MLAEKLEDLENRSRRNNLRIIGVPETVKLNDLLKLCEKTLPRALGMTGKMMVEWAHRIGAIQTQGTRKPFSKICSQLYTRKIKFTLAYPAVLQMMALNGKQLSFYEPGDAEAILEEQDQQDATSPVRTLRSSGNPPKIYRKILNMPYTPKSRRKGK